MYVFLHEVACFNECTLTVVASGLHAEYIRYCLLWTFILVQAISCDAYMPFPFSIPLPRAIKHVLRKVAQTTIKFTICAK